MTSIDSDQFFRAWTEGENAKCPWDIAFYNNQGRQYLWLLAITIPKNGVDLENEILFCKRRPLLRRESKLKMTEFLPLVVYQFLTWYIDYMYFYPFFIKANIEPPHYNFLSKNEGSQCMFYVEILCFMLIVWEFS